MGVPRSLTRRVRTLKPLGLCRAFVSITTGRSGRLLIFVRRAAHSHRLVPDSARPLQQDRAKGKRFVNSERPRQFERPTRDLSWWPIPGWISRWQLGLAGGLLGGLLAELALGLYIWSGDMPGLSGIVVGLVFGLAFGLLIGLRSMDRPMG